MTGERPLRKVFRFRCIAEVTLEQATEHWRGFEWEAGPVIVTNEGHPWGKPQVWAASAEEGKRVIRHAGALAGVDPDAYPGRWSIATSTNPRFGKTGTMAPKILKGGAISVTMRDGPSALPDVLVPDL